MTEYKFKARRLLIIMESRAIMAQVLARDLGITKSALSRKINGSRPWQLDELKKISQILNLPQGFIFPALESEKEK